MAAPSEGNCSSDFDDFEENYGCQPPEEDLFRPTLADQLKIGFFSLDRATQTKASEIIDLKEMTKVIERLLKDTSSMQRDINFARHVMQADFEQKLQQKSIDLYVRVNERLTDISKMHEERVDTVRRAFKQQLSDAIARMHTYYTSPGDRKTLPPEMRELREFAEKMKREKYKKDASSRKYEEKLKEMQSTIQRNESMISMLKLQLQQGGSENTTKRTIRWPDDDISPEVRYVRSPGAVEEIDDLREEVDRLKEHIIQLEDVISAGEENSSHRNTELAALNEKLEKEKKLAAQLKAEHEAFAEMVKQERASSNKSDDTLLESQKLEMEREMETRIRKAKEEALTAAQGEIAAYQEAERAKLTAVMEEKKKVETMLAMAKSKADNKMSDDLDVEKARRNEQRLMIEIGRLKKEIDRVHRTWEKKFAILQQSLHALKDESYLRQTLQRQAAQLHQASIAYAYDHPLGIAPHRQSGNKPPLPDIGSKYPGKTDVPDYISYTVSAPSGRATHLLSRAEQDENQVMSEDEQDLPLDVVPIPSPPSRIAAQCADEESRPARPHVVVLPQTT